MLGRRPSVAAMALLLVSLAALPPAHADDVADFYKGKTVRVVIGTGVGGTYGVYGQLVARHSDASFRDIPRSSCSRCRERAALPR